MENGHGSNQVAAGVLLVTFFRRILWVFHRLSDVVSDVSTQQSFYGSSDGVQNDLRILRPMFNRPEYRRTTCLRAGGVHDTTGDDGLLLGLSSFLFFLQRGNDVRFEIST